MSAHENEFADIAQKVKNAIGDGAEPAMLARHEDIFVSLAERQIGRNRSRIPLYVAAAFAAAFLAGMLLVPRAPAPLRFTIGPDAAPGRAGTWVATTDGGQTDIRFAQGSRFRVFPQSAARVTRADDSEVAIELHAGSVKASVNGNGRTRWRIHAGPYKVTVLGTRFEVQWETRSGELRVDVSKGVVLVQGQGLEHHGIRLTAGRTLLANALQDTFRLEATAAIDNRPAPESARSGVNRPGPEPALSEKATPKETATTEPAASAIEQPFACNPDDAGACLSSARRKGLPQIFQQGTLADLWALQEAARTTGDMDVFNGALIALRGRFPDSGKARLAAFLLGRSAMDIALNHSQAAQWFSTYLKEAPRGPMAEEAYGRLMTSYDGIGRRDLSIRVAQSYLTLYPGGLYENKARMVLHP